jgi:general secretion pathway protein A
MYAQYFCLSEIPYKITPDPRFLWYSDQYKEAKAKIEYHLSQKDGPVYLSAEVGLGKTSIAQRLRDEFAADKSKTVVLAFSPNLKTANQFMRFVAEEFDVRTA